MGRASDGPQLSLSVVGVRVATPTVIGSTRQGEVTSAIAKRPVTAAALLLGPINLAGDDQADRQVHGGPDKSVYVYPAEHAADWSADGFDLPEGSVGENVIVSGATEDAVRIGDVFRWGRALVQVSQPRAPCYKLALHSGRKDIAAAMIDSGRCGWYLRTVEPGEVPTTGTLSLVERDDRNAAVAIVFAAMFPGRRAEADDPAAVAQVVHSPSLAAEWLAYLRARNPLAAAVS